VRPTARLAATATAVACAQLAPAATWLPPLRRLLPPLESPMPAGSTAVTFDDGPHPDGTPAVLDALEELGWQATFFMLGSAVERFPGTAREVVRRGHQVGVHGWDHRYLLTRTPGETWRDLRRAADVVSQVSGARLRWWRPPYGVLTMAGLAAARATQLRPVLWSAWGKDWRGDATPAGIAREVRRGRLCGGTVLLHDSDATSAAGSWRNTVHALPLIAEELALQGLSVAPLPPPVARGGAPLAPAQDNGRQPSQQWRQEHHDCDR
jgi:peptidoglycan/xylan/chitin deacetylase (PgdA/CDA1 family)